ncbi:hypothetical protein CSKR_107354 [Clonorchis sinensis]|uniref:Uncharacterized protein n=1 Tax=Clonorchis sinensis TaxID=79923 RepID=A0A3R7JQN3_CLOSI|nr:hypothetical protein CSKR_107354 [Clonorchis sinensis]
MTSTIFYCPAVTPFRCLAAMPPERSKRARMHLGCPSLDRSGGDAEVGLERSELRYLEPWHRSAATSFSFPNQAQWASHGSHPERRLSPTTPKRFVTSFVLLCQAYPCSSGAGHILQWNYPLHNRKLVLQLLRYGFADTNPHEHGSETTTVEDLKTSQSRCSNRPGLSYKTKQPLLTNTSPRYVKRSTNASTSPWIVRGAFCGCMSGSMTLHFVGAKCMPKNRMTLVSSSENIGAFCSSSRTRITSSAYSRSTRSSSPEFLGPFSARPIISSITKLDKN